MISVAMPHNPLKQAIVTGITNWLNDQAPASVVRDMRHADILRLLESIAASVGEEHIVDLCKPT